LNSETTEVTIHTPSFNSQKLHILSTRRIVVATKPYHLDRSTTGRLCSSTPPLMQQSNDQHAATYLPQQAWVRSYNLRTTGPVDRITAYSVLQSYKTIRAGYTDRGELQSLSHSRRLLNPVRQLRYRISLQFSLTLHVCVTSQHASGYSLTSTSSF